MARRSRPAQGRNSTKKIVKIKAGGPLLRRTVNKSNTRPRRGP